MLSQTAYKTVPIDHYGTGPYKWCSGTFYTVMVFPIATAVPSGICILANGTNYKEVERVMGIEPTYPDWKSGALADVLHPQISN